MRRLLVSVAMLVLAGCGAVPEQPQPVSAPPVLRPVQRSDLQGLTIDELGERFGQPTFQVREGPGLKLQWATSSCVLDTFLYASPGSTVMRVAYVDARRPSGDPTDRSACISAVAAR